MAPSTGQASRQALQLTQSSATTKNQVVALAFSPSPFLMQSTGHTSTQELSPSQISFTITYAIVLLRVAQVTWSMRSRAALAQVRVGSGTRIGLTTSPSTRRSSAHNRFCGEI